MVNGNRRIFGCEIGASQTHSRTKCRQILTITWLRIVNQKATHTNRSTSVINRLSIIISIKFSCFSIYCNSFVPVPFPNVPIPFSVIVSFSVLVPFSVPVPVPIFIPVNLSVPVHFFVPRTDQSSTRMKQVRSW